MSPLEIKEVEKGFQFGGKRLTAKVEETHISWVLLADQYAFKVKKPVKFSFLDFSTLQLRKKACEKEVILNRRLSSIYLRVVPVKFHKGSWHFGNRAGRIVDYAVVMRRLRSNKRMDLLLGKKR
jgi:aminoglycoside phosphotransferase family enzyme